MKWFIVYLYYGEYVYQRLILHTIGMQNEVEACLFNEIETNLLRVVCISAPWGTYRDLDPKFIKVW